VSERSEMHKLRLILNAALADRPYILLYPDSKQEEELCILCRKTNKETLIEILEFGLKAIKRGGNTEYWGKEDGTDRTQQRRAPESPGATD
jgi:hypothetical protein